MKRSKLCFGLLSVLSIMLGLSLSVSLDSSALKHEYTGLSFGGYDIPAPRHNSDTDTNYLDWSDPHTTTYYGAGNFSIEFRGDAYSDYESDISMHPNYNFSYLSSLAFNGSTCSWGSGSHILPIFTKTSYSDGFSINGHGMYFYHPDLIPALDNYDYSRCYLRSAYGNPPSPSFDYSSIPNTSEFCSVFDNGCNVAGLFSYFQNTYIQDHLKPNWYSSDGLYLHSTVVDTESGVHYNNTFSLSDLYSKPIHKFSKLVIPLAVYDDYFLDPSNLYAGRSFEVSGVFEFDGSFAWHPGIDSTGSFTYEFDGVRLHGSDLTWQRQSVVCTANLRTVSASGVTQLEYSCPGSYDYDYLFITSNSIVLSNQNNYVFVTDADWRFASTYLITDADSTPAYSFNTELTGNEIVGQVITPDSEEDWTQSLNNLFNFSVVNPFAPLFSLFTDGTSCASIPTIAGMLGSTETTYCPWFDSTTRSVLTPVLGLSATMLLFGFFVRWLGASSGNFFEDSGSHQTNSFKIKQKGRK